MRPGRACVPGPAVPDGKIRPPGIATIERCAGARHPNTRAFACRSSLPSSTREPDHSPPAFDCPPFHADSLATGANDLRSRLKKAGIAVDLRARADFPSRAQRIWSRDCQFAMNTRRNHPDPVVGVHRICLCANIRKIIRSNTQGYCNGRVDALLRQAGSTLDVRKRKALYEEFQGIVNEDCPSTSSTSSHWSRYRTGRT